MDTEKNILYSSILGKITELMPLPNTIQKIASLTKNPETPLKTISRELESDQAMVSKVLKLANSSFYGFSKQVRTISHAVVCLGYNSIRQMVLTAHSFSILDKELKSYYLEKGEMFNHSFAVALASRIIASKISYPNPEEVYLMGLLHDIGKVVINQYAPKEFENVILLYNKGDITFCEAEHEVLGFDHGEIGSAVCHKWNLSDDIIETIKIHHNPEIASEFNLAVHIVHIANSIISMLGIGACIGSIEQKISGQSLKKLNLQSDDISKLMLLIMEALEQEDSLNKSSNI
jgi:putative nucleotidyltransferase with HDIG domain